MTVVQIGPSLAKIEKGNFEGAPLPDILTIERPEIGFDFGSLKESQDALVVFRSKAQGYLLRGQVFFSELNGLMGFAGSPWFTRGEDLQASGLTLADLALHDPLADLLHLLQNHQMAFADMERLARKLRNKQADLHSINKALEAEMEVRTKAEANSRAASRRLATLVDSLQGAILVEDENRRIVHVNQGFCRMFNIPVEPGTLTGADCTALAEQGQHAFAEPESFLSDIDRILAAKERVAGQDIRLRDGRILSRDYTPIYIEDQYAGHFWHYEDVTERRQAQEQQNLLLQKLQKKNEELNEFAYVVSHDLKAPLRGMDALVSWLICDQSAALDDAGREHLDLLRNRVRRTNALIDGILQYSRAGRLREEAALVDVSDVVEEVLDLIHIPPSMRVIVHQPLPTLVCERRRLVQILQNLLSNSVKHMDKPQGRIEISATEEPGACIFRVQDTGPGIELKYHQKVFQLFQTLSPRESADNTGIGLAIVKKNVEISGGKIWIESPPAGGVTFVFTWPKTPERNSTARSINALLC